MIIFYLLFAYVHLSSLTNKNLHNFSTNKETDVTIKEQNGFR